MSAPAVVSGARWAALPLVRWSVAIIVAVVGGIFVFEAFDVSVFRRIGMAHEYCYLREPRLIWLHVVSDLLIGVAYVSISATLGFLVYKASRDIPFNWILLAFGLFIVSCGLTHFMEVWVIWEPVYWMSGYVKILTAAASVATAIALFPLVPKIFRLIENARNGERRRIEIEQLNDELERFNYTVAHDLRAPLRGIIGFGHALREDCADQLTLLGRDYITRMQHSAGLMDTLICDLLEYATIGRQQLQRKPIALEEALAATQDLLAKEIRDTNSVIRIVSPLPSVLADATLLQVVLQNLLSNAIKFVAPGVRPAVEISAVSTAAGVTLSISDNGIGIPAGSRGQLFRMFERLHPGYPGTGMGLAIVNRAVERLDGQVGMDDVATGGSRFWVQFPPR